MACGPLPDARSGLGRDERVEHVSRFIEGSPRYLVRAGGPPGTTILHRVIEMGLAWMNPPSDAELHLQTVLASCIPLMSIWVVSDTTQMREHVVRYHRNLEEYGGYLLLFDVEERVVLLDLTEHQYVRYVERSNWVVVVIDGVENAKMFVDRLGQRLGQAK